MNTEARKRLTTLFYVLTRDHLPWGTLHDLIDKHTLVGDGEHVYASEAARVLADAAIDRLLTGSTQALAPESETDDHNPGRTPVEQHAWDVAVRVINNIEQDAHSALVDFASEIASALGCTTRYPCDIGADELAAVIRDSVARVREQRGCVGDVADPVSRAGWSKLCAAVGLVESAGVDDVVSVIESRHREEREAVATLAAYCPEADPGKMSLSDVVGLLESDVLAEPDEAQPAQTASAIAAGSRVFVKPECPLRGATRPGHAGIVTGVGHRPTVGDWVINVRHADGAGVIYDFDHLITVKELVGRTFQHRDGVTSSLSHCVLVSVSTNVCAIRWFGDDYENGIGVDYFLNGRFTLLPESERSSESGSAVVAARLRSAVMAVTGVSKVDVELDVDGDAWSARAVVSGGDDVEIAKAIAAACPVWFDTLGQVRVRVPIGAQDNSFTNIAFDRPIPASPNQAAAAAAIVEWCARTNRRDPLRHLVDSTRQRASGLGIAATITVDTSTCSFDSAVQYAIALAQEHVRVRFHHGCATVCVEALDTPATLHDRWQREADHVQAQRRRRADSDGRSRIAHDLRDAGFSSAGWSDDASEIVAITLSCEDAKLLLASGGPHVAGEQTRKG